MKRGSRQVAVGILALVAGYLLFLLWPFYIELLVSVKPSDQIFTRPFGWLPRDVVMANYGDVLRSDTPPFARFLLNSLIVAGATTVSCLVFGSMAAYALARYRMPGKNLLLASLLAVAVFPPIAIISPLYMQLRAMGLLNSYAGLTLVYTAFGMPLAIWFLTAYIREIPADLEEAARVDGCAEWQVLWRILLPVAMPGFMTTGILIFVQAWNEFFFALVFNPSWDYTTATVGIVLFPGLHEIPWGSLFAAAVVVTLPPVALVLAVQRRIISGLTSGAVKG
jgi:multiple sugar transport system permease protein